MERLKEKFLLLYQFLVEVKTELKKVSWPSRRDTLGSTAVVMVLIILMAIYLGLVDLGLTRIITVVLR